MNGSSIEKALDRCRPTFRGVYSIDTLPTNGRGLMVVNTDPSDRPGTHWIAIYVDSEGIRGEYFDSLGREPHAIFRRYLQKNCEDWIYNERQIQSVASRFCGHYCVYYCTLRCHGVDLRRIVSHFTDDTGFNDVLVHDFVCLNKYLN